MLNFLTCNLVSIDVETTGLNPKEDRIIQLGVVILKPDGTTLSGQQRFNPQREMHPDAQNAHGISLDDLKDEPEFSSHAQQIQDGLKGADVCGYNVGFDLAFLKAELMRCDIVLEHGFIVDPLAIWKHQEKRSLVSARKRWLNEEGEDAHDALVDAKATLEVLVKQLETWPDLPRSIEGLHVLTRETAPDGYADIGRKFKWDGSELKVAFGKKWNGVNVRRVDRGYFHWIVKSDFHPSTQHIASEILAGRFPSR